MKPLSIGFLASSLIFLALTILVLSNNTTAKDKVLEDLNDSTFLINISTIIVFTIILFIVSSKNSSLRESCIHAWIAFIIAYFARLDMTIAPFWMVFILAYFLEMV